jgi:hypothetical protein
LGVAGCAAVSGVVGVSERAGLPGPQLSAAGTTAASSAIRNLLRKDRP